MSKYNIESYNYVLRTTSDGPVVLHKASDTKFTELKCPICLYVEHLQSFWQLFQNNWERFKTKSQKMDFESFCINNYSL